HDALPICQRALPAGMRRADHARLGIHEQDRPAVGRGDADGKALVLRHDGVRLRPRRARPRAAGDQRIRRMDLMHADEMRGCNAHLPGHAAAVLRDMRGIIVRAEPAVEAGIDAVRYAAVAGEEGVAQAGNGRQQGRGKHQEAPADSFSSLKPGSVTRFCSETPSTLNSDPMPPRPVLVNRFSALEISSETSCEAFAISVTARVSMPSRLRNSPWVTGPCTRAPTASAADPSAWKST